MRKTGRGNEYGDEE